MNAFIEKELGIDAIISARKLGDRICLIELNDVTDNEKVMKNKSKLKGHTGEKIFINEYMTKSDRNAQQILRAKVREERLKGKNVKIGHQKLKTGNEEWR